MLNFKLLLPLLLLAIVFAGCTKVDKPVRGDEDDSKPMNIVIDGDARKECEICGHDAIFFKREKGI